MHKTAYEIRCYPAAYVGATVRFTSKSWNGRPGTGYEGELISAEAIVPVGNETFTGLRIVGTRGTIWADNDAIIEVFA